MKYVFKLMALAPHKTNYKLAELAWAERKHRGYRAQGSFIYYDVSVLKCSFWDTWLLHVLCSMEISCEGEGKGMVLTSSPDLGPKLEHFFQAITEPPSASNQEAFSQAFHRLSPTGRTPLSITGNNKFCSSTAYRQARDLYTFYGLHLHLRSLWRHYIGDYVRMLCVGIARQYG